MELKELALLTTREKEILSLVRQKKSNQKIADLLFISKRTVEIHLSHIHRKLGIKIPNARAELIKLAGPEPVQLVPKEITHSCGTVIKNTDSVYLRQDRKPGINPFESALAHPEGFTDPKPACPQCRQYLTEKEIEVIYL